jgi:hypothetical protein
MMSPGRRKVALTVHLTFSIGWIGAVIAYLGLGVAAVSGEQVRTVRAAWTAMELIGWFVIVPLAVGSLLTGVIMGLGTKWGLFRHYWVVFSLGLTVFATVILLFHMPTVSSVATVAQQAERAALESLGGDLFHPAVGLVVLLVIQVLNMYKPQGLTPYGQRKQAAGAESTAVR